MTRAVWTCRILEFDDILARELHQYLMLDIVETRIVSERLQAVVAFELGKNGLQVTGAGERLGQSEHGVQCGCKRTWSLG